MIKGDKLGIVGKRLFEVGQRYLGMKAVIKRLIIFQISNIVDLINFIVFIYFIKQREDAIMIYFESDIPHYILQSNSYNPAIQTQMQNNIQQLTSEMNQIIKFSNQFQIQKHDENTDIFTSTTHSYLMKNMQICQVEQLQTILHTLSIHQDLSSKYLLTLLHYELSQAFDGEQYIKAVYQYGNLSLKEEIQNRLALETPFEEDQLWAIFIMVIKALGHLQEHNIVYGVLGTDKIFINQTARLLDPSATATNPLLITQNRLYSPQILSNEQEINIFKSDVYVLGLLMIECGLLIDLSHDKESTISHYLQVFAEKYSEELCKLLESMLNYNPDKRPTFTKLKEYLVEQMQLNTTQLNDTVQTLPTDSEDNHSNLFIIDSIEQQSTDILFQNKQLLINVYQQQELSDYEKAVRKFMKFPDHDIEPFTLTQQHYHAKLINVNCAKRVPAPKTHRKLPTEDCHHKYIQDERKLDQQDHLSNKENYVQSKIRKHKYTSSQIDNSVQLRYRHQYRRSTGNRVFRNSTREIKNKLVTKQQRGIRQEERQYQENSSLISNGYESKKQENISTVSKHDKNLLSCQVSQQLDHLPYGNPTSNRTSHTTLFTDPNFLKTINQGISRIQSVKNSVIRP